MTEQSLSQSSTDVQTASTGLHPVLERMRGGLIASAQAYPGEPMRDPRTMDEVAQACVAGGAVGIRAQGLADLALICQHVDVPVIGLWKDGHDGVFITPTLTHAITVAAAANFPVLFLSVFWKGTTTRGAVIGGFLGLIASVVLTILSPSVWEATFGNPVGSAPFPYTSPALFSMIVGFLGVWLFSLFDNSATAAQEREAFEAQQVRSETGYGAAKASAH